MDFLEIWQIIEENLVTILGCIGTILAICLKPQKSAERIAANEKKRNEKRLAKLKQKQNALIAKAKDNAAEQEKLEKEIAKNA